jgi:nucleotide sugar dehydrogenase
MGKSHVEDISDGVIAQHLESGAYHVSSDYADAEGFDTAVITVPTPLKDGRPDLSFIEQSAQKLADFIKPDSLIILESTTYPGTTEELLIPILEAGTDLRVGTDFSVGYSPERIDPGNRQWNLLNTPKVVSGVDEASLAKVKDFYTSLGISVVPVSGTREAELTKLLENTFRHVNIALMNELAVFAEQLNVNIWEAINAASTKPFGYMRFIPGPGVGGHCLPIDPSYLSWAIEQKVGKPFRFVELANSVNENMPHYVVQRVGRMLGVSRLKDKSILLVGLAYKPNTGDIRESPALDIARILISYGAQVSSFDPQVVDALWPSTINRVSAIEGGLFDAVVVVTNHDSVDLDALNKLEIPILDTRNSMTGPHVEIL